MGLHIEECIDKYKKFFSQEDNSNGSSEKHSPEEEEVFTKEKYEEFERIFFIEMNNALFVGE